MARGFSSAPGASKELREAQEPELDRLRMLELGTARNTLVRACVAGRLDCPFGLMVTLAHDYSAEVRSAVAANPRAQSSVMQYLSADKSVPVVLALLTNPSVSQELLEELAFHKKSEVRAAASARLDRGAPAMSHEAVEDEHTPELAEHPSLALDVDDFGYTYGSIAQGQGEEQAPTPQESWSVAVHSDGGGERLGAPGAGGVPDEMLVDAAVSSVSRVFAETPPQGNPLVTRTAPVRGFRAPSG